LIVLQSLQIQPGKPNWSNSKKSHWAHVLSWLPWSTVPPEQKNTAQSPFWKSTESPKVAARKLMADLTSQAERNESEVGHTVTHETARQKSADAAGGAALRKKVKVIALTMSSLLAAASALADATDEHRSYDSSGENGGEKHLGEDALLKTSGKDLVVFAAMVAVMRKKAYYAGRGQRVAKGRAR
jgi:hypothetical protein